jgi:hypothetical protein
MSMCEVSAGRPAGTLLVESPLDEAPYVRFSIQVIHFSLHCAPMGKFSV